MASRDRIVTSNMGRWMLYSALFIFSAFYMAVFFYVEEDSYIYYRVAENIADGYGYVFNKTGEPIESGSGPLWQYILSLGAWVGADVALLSKLLGFVFGILTIITVYLATNKLTSQTFAGLAAFVLANSVPFVWWASSGMESSLFTLLMATCVYIATDYKNGRHSWLGAIPYALLLFARPEGFIFIFVFIPYLWMMGGKSFAAKILASCAISYGFYLVFRYFYFEDFQISAFYAKISDGQVLWAYLLETLRGLRWHYLFLLIIPATLCALKSKARPQMLLLILLSCLGLYFAAANYDFKAYFRFFSHSLPQILILFFLSAHVLSLRMPGPFRNFVYVYVLIACAAVIWIPRVDHMGTKQGNPLYRSVSIIINNPEVALESYHSKISDLHQETQLDELLQREVPYVAYYNYQALIGRFLSLNYPKGVVIAHDQMGQTPYFAGRDKEFIDFLGLITKPVSLFMFNQNAQSSYVKRTYKALADELISIKSRSNRDIDIDAAFAHITKTRPDIVMISWLVAASIPNSMTAHVANSHWLKDNYTKKYNVAGLVDIYENNEKNFPLRYKHSMPSLNFREHLKSNSD